MYNHVYMRRFYVFDKIHLLYYNSNQLRGDDMNNYEGPLMKAEVLDNIFLFDRGDIKILLLKNETEPYKGYWFLPRCILLEEETIEEAAKQAAYEFTGLTTIDFSVNTIFSDTARIPTERVLGISAIGLTDSVTISLKQEGTNHEYSWFSVESLPKMVYDHSKIAGKAIEDLKNILNSFTMMRRIFPSDFTLPELQRAYEEIWQETFDRRNFRKKLLTLDVLEETGDSNIGESGRPAKLYRFKENLENKKMF